MDIDKQVKEIVQNLVGQITTQIQSQVVNIVEQKINDSIKSIDYTPIISSILNQKLGDRIAQLPISTNSIEQVLTGKVTELATNISVDVKQQASILIKNNVDSALKLLDLHDSYHSALTTAIASRQFVFPENSIPASALLLQDIKLTGDSISGGIVTNFGSTGIEDMATGCQLTITDDVTVVENNLLTKDLTVKGTTTIEGDLIVTGNIPDNSPMFVKFVNAAATTVKTTLNQQLFEDYSKIVVDQLYKDGLNLNQIKINGQEVINGNALGNFVTHSNLQKVGILQELQTTGESFLSQTLYVSQNRVGVNTIEPTHALSIWDQEIELGFGKLETNTAFISTPRSQKLVLGSNGKKNLVLIPDGSVEVSTIKINNMVFTTGSEPPNYEAARGTIVFNENPTLGGPLGWVSLGEARWANFGIID